MLHIIIGNGVDYIYINSLDKSKYLFIIILHMIFSNFIQLLTPGNEQLLSVSGSQLRLRFATWSILVNIESLWGEGEVFFRN